jgi:hypothetical protein
MTTKQYKPHPLINTYGVIRSDVVPTGSRRAGTLVKVVRVTPAYYMVEEVYGNKFTRQVYNAEIRFIKDEKELFLYMLKAK